MKDIFLGKALHWLALIAIIPIMAVIGKLHIHVSQFNSYIGMVIIIVVVLLAIIILPHRPGEQLTRESLEDE
ncbi:MAG: hypothetical protein HQ513_09450 [Rhodospirillales bacterium]|nr:hypothetical protein [Rhodospirillales bacterium]